MYTLTPGSRVLVEIEGKQVLAKVLDQWCNGYRLARLQDALPYPSRYWAGSIVSVTAPFAFAPDGHTLIAKGVARFA